MAERDFTAFGRSRDALRITKDDERLLERCNDIHVVCGRQHPDEHCLQGAIADIVLAAYSYLTAYESGTDDDLYEAEKGLVDTLKTHRGLPWWPWWCH